MHNGDHKISPLEHLIIYSRNRLKNFLLKKHSVFYLRFFILLLVFYFKTISLPGITLSENNQISVGFPKRLDKSENILSSRQKQKKYRQCFVGMIMISR